MNYSINANEPNLIPTIFNCNKMTVINCEEFENLEWVMINSVTTEVMAYGTITKGRKDFDFGVKQENNYQLYFKPKESGELEITETDFPNNAPQVYSQEEMN